MRLRGGSFSYALVVAAESIVLSVSYSGRVHAWSVDSGQLLSEFPGVVSCDAVTRVGEGLVVMQARARERFRYFIDSDSDDDENASDRLVLWEVMPVIAPVTSPSSTSSGSGGATASVMPAASTASSFGGGGFDEDTCTSPKTMVPKLVNSIATLKATPKTADDSNKKSGEGEEEEDEQQKAAGEEGEEGEEGEDGEERWAYKKARLAEKKRRKAEFAKSVTVLIDSKAEPDAPVFSSLTLVDQEHLAGMKEETKMDERMVVYDSSDCLLCDVTSCAGLWWLGSTDDGEWLVFDLLQRKVVGTFAGTEHQEQTLVSILD